MAEWRSLAEVAVQPEPGRAFTAAGRDSRDHAHFHRDVLRWRTAFAASPAHAWALHFEDAACFAAALYGAWHAGKTVVLPGDALAGTQARLQGRVDGFAGDWPQATLTAPADDVSATPLQPLDAEAARLVVFTSGSTGEPVAIEKRLRQLDAEVHALEAALPLLPKLEAEAAEGMRFELVMGETE